MRRVQIAVGVLLAVSAGNAYLLGKDLWRLRAPGDELAWEVEPYIARLAEVRQLLPPDARIAFASAASSDAARRRDLFLTRYALAPRCVTDAGEAPWLLVHGAVPVAAGTAAQLHAELGDGFRLYRSAPAP